METNNGFSTVFESMDNEDRTAKEAGLSKEDAMAFEKKECSKALHAELVKEDVSENDFYRIIHEHIAKFSECIVHTEAIYN